MLRRTKNFFTLIVISLFIIGAGCSKQNEWNGLEGNGATPNSTSTVQNIEDEQFACGGLDGFTFKYPSYQNVKFNTDALPNQQCLVKFGEHFELEITKAFYHGAVGKMTAPTHLKLKNPQGVPYAFDSKKELAEFWTEDAVVNIRKINMYSPINLKGFNEENFWKQIIDSFEIKK